MNKTAAFEAGVADGIEKIAIGDTARGMAALGRVAARKFGMEAGAKKKAPGAVGRLFTKPTKVRPEDVAQASISRTGQRVERAINRPSAMRGPKAEKAFQGGMKQEAAKRKLTLPGKKGLSESKGIADALKTI